MWFPNINTNNKPGRSVFLLSLLINSTRDSLSTAPRTVGLKWGSEPGTVAMQQSLDHSLYFYDHDFDHGDWMLYVMISPALGMGRGIVHGRIYDRNGKLCAIAGQEGVVRTHDGRKSKSKL